MIKEYLRKKILEIGEDLDDHVNNYLNCQHCIYYKEIVNASESTTGYTVDECLYNDGLHVPYWRNWIVCDHYKCNTSRKERIQKRLNQENKEDY